MPRTAKRSIHDEVIYSNVGREPGKLYGSVEPRIYTEPLRELTPETSYGFAAIEFAEEVLGIRLHPWQKWLFVHALEVMPDGQFRYRTIIVLIARQSGKSTVSQVLSLFFLYILGVGLVLGTAQDLDTAEEVWEGAQEMIDGNVELAALALPPIKVNGKKTIRLKSGERYKVKAASRKAGRGLSGDLILLDEIREMTDWGPYAALGATTTARPNAQIWALSNAGDAASIVLRYLRKMAHKALGDPDGIVANEDPSRLLDPEAEEAAVEADETLGLFEWSAPANCPVDDRAGWQQANPSLGYTIAERTIVSACKTNPEWVFRTEHLCQWSDGTLEGPFPTGSWEHGIDGSTPSSCYCKGEDADCAHPGSSIAPGSEIALCLDVNWERTHAHIAAAGLRADGLPHVEIIASRLGTDWVKGWFSDPDHPERLKYKVAIQASGPAGALVEELVKHRVNVVDWKGSDLGKACGRFYDLVRDDYLRHLPQPLLDVAAATAVTKPLGDSWVWDRKKSPVDCSPLMAATGAVWLIAPRPEQGPPQVHGWDPEEIARWEKEALGQ